MITDIIAPLYVAVPAAFAGFTYDGKPLPIFETVPKGQVFPYLTYQIGISPGAERRGEAEMQINLWHTAAVEIVAAMSQAVSRLLDRKRLTTTVGNATVLLDSMSPIGRDPKTGVRNAPQIYRILLHT